MTDKDRAFEEWWTTSAPLQPMTPTAFNAGWDAHAERVKPLIEAGRRFKAAFDRAESNRGCYSTAPEHDCRCEFDRGISNDCTCGSVELNEADVEFTNALDALTDREGEKSGR
jgi:hypothetical protein